VTTAIFKRSILPRHRFELTNPCLNRICPACRLAIRSSAGSQACLNLFRSDSMQVTQQPAHIFDRDAGRHILATLPDEAPLDNAGVDAFHEFGGVERESRTVATVAPHQSAPLPERRAP